MTVTTEGRAAIEEALTSLVETARRCPAVVRRFTEDPPTAWDRRHEDIDALLDRITDAVGSQPTN